MPDVSLPNKVFTFRYITSNLLLSKLIEIFNFKRLLIVLTNNHRISSQILSALNSVCPDRISAKAYRNKVSFHPHEIVYHLLVLPERHILMYLQRHRKWTYLEKIDENRKDV